ncbi:hypothetical protein BJ170DRAFT_687117 [Xylariales sp. AK1849]|nr:hypothetical protein BJ170DRAFT_687117 [Xylariales sp. AK1849]
MAPLKNDFLIQSFPPPYEAEAYAHQTSSRFKRRLRRACSIPVILALIVASVVLYLCLILGKEASLRSSTAFASASVSLKEFQESLDLCAARNHFPPNVAPEFRDGNPRWNSIRGQNETVTLRNATLFDGESFSPTPVDIVFSKGLVISVSPTSTRASILDDGLEFDLMGKYVTPGIVDMHSHHMIGTWPSFQATDDGNEIHPLFGPLTPFVRAIEGMKAYDTATKLIASGGITSSLIIPGSANTMGGEGTAVKNVMKSGDLGEYIVEEMLLERGIPVLDRHRWLKMACGENPRSIYGHTRMGLAYILRQHLTRARQLMDKQEKWCDAASRLHTAAQQSRFIGEMGGYPEELELESTIGLIRGRVAMHNHCYEPEDLETMLGVMREFGNVTIATFAETALYKHEAYDPSLYAGAILNAHGIPVAYKSDHSQVSTSAKYVMSQAAAGHAFHLPADKALQAVTSIPANAIDLANRIGYVRKGYDADIVVWDSHPLSIGATPQQVFIDGVAKLDPKAVEQSTGSSMGSPATSSTTTEVPQMRTRKLGTEVEQFCSSAKSKSQSFVVHGIRKSFLDNHPQLRASVSTSGRDNLTLVINEGRVSCLGNSQMCGESIAATSKNAVQITLNNGHLLPGLTAVTMSLGMIAIALAEDTGNGFARVKDVTDPAYIDYAKYGVTLDGKAFTRARLGGVTRALTPPGFPVINYMPTGMLQGVSVGIKTSGTKTILDGGIFQDDVGLHMTIGEVNKAVGSVSMAVKTLRGILAENKGKGNASAYGLVADGLMPLIIEVQSVPHTQQVVSIKKDFPDVNIIIRGGYSAPLVAKELAEANIPVILSATRPGPASWAGKDCLTGPPLTRSPASVLGEAGVHYAVSVESEIPVVDSRIHDLALEAAWVAKYAGLSEHEAVRLVTKNVEDILGLKPSKDIVLWENSPLQWGGSVVLSFEETEGGNIEVGTCWPDDTTEGPI